MPSQPNAYAFKEHNKLNICKPYLHQGLIASININNNNNLLKANNNNQPKSNQNKGTIINAP